MILGSRSPRRRELLSLVVPAALIELLPPRNAAEAGFADCPDWPAIQARLAEIARDKARDVQGQVRDSSGDVAREWIVIAADTEIVVQDRTGRLHVLGQPPEGEAWKPAVRHWFTEYYAGRCHWAVTALCIQTSTGATIERRVETQVEFRADVERWLDWYLALDESPGKAGGYALQGAASVFVSRVSGSLSNVVGLPLEALLEVLDSLGLDFGNLQASQD